MSVLDKFKKRNEEVRLSSDIPMEIPSRLPDDLERFRIPQTETPRSDFYDKPLEIPSDPLPQLMPSPQHQSFDDNKIELILQKLDTIDTRLKLIEERVKRY